METTIRTIHPIGDKAEIKQLHVLGRMLLSVEMIVKSMCDDFNINNAPSMVLLFDMKRCMFWKQSKYGYTESINDAGLFYLEEAKKIVECDYDKNTKIVWF